MANPCFAIKKKKILHVCLLAFQKTKEITVFKGKETDGCLKLKNNMCDDRTLTYRHFSFTEQSEVGTGSLFVKSGK